MEAYYMSEIAREDSCTADLMRNEWQMRLESFEGFPRGCPATPTALAQAGFYYTGFSDQAMCFQCGLIHSNWRPGVSVLELHHQLSPECLFLRNKDGFSSKLPALRNKKQVTCSAKYTFSGNRSTPEEKLQTEVYTVKYPPVITGEAELKKRHVSKSKHPDFDSYKVRLSSFSGWTSSDIQKPEVLAEAGFFYAGFSDCVRCFHCGGGLRNWQQGDCVTTEHARWYPDCDFLKAQTRQTDVITETSQVQQLLQIPEVTSQEIRYDEHADIEETKWHCNTPTAEMSLSSVDEVLFTAAAMAVMEMGYKPEQVLTAVETFKITKGRDDFSSEALLEIMFQYEGEDSNAKAWPNEPPVPPPAKQEPSQQVACSIQDENTKLKQQFACKTCLVNEACVLFLPCGHMVSCNECAHLHVKCCICRKKVNATVRAFIA